MSIWMLKYSLLSFYGAARVAYAGGEVVGNRFFAESPSRRGAESLFQWTVFKWKTKSEELKALPNRRIVESQNRNIS